MQKAASCKTAVEVRMELRIDIYILRPKCLRVSKNIMGDFMNPATSFTNCDALASLIGWQSLQASRDCLGLVSKAQLNTRRLGVKLLRALEKQLELEMEIKLSSCGN